MRSGSVVWYAVYVFMSILFVVFYQPVVNLLFFLMDVVRTDSIVLGILLLVVAVKLLLLPTSVKNTKIQHKLSEITDDLKDIKENIDDKKEQMEKTLAVYKKAGVNPFSPILFLLLQIPFFISIFFVTKDLGDGTFNADEALYSFVAQPAVIDFTISFGPFFLDTMQSGVLAIAVLIGISQFVLMYQTQKKNTNTQKNMKALIYILPALIAFLSISIVATIGVYWLFNNLVSILQETGVKWFGRGDTTTPPPPQTDQGGTL